MIVSGNQIPAFQMPETAWKWGCGLIERFGERVLTEDGQTTQEIRNLVLQVEEPGRGWPIAGSGWDLPALNVYAETEILSGNVPGGFRYTYGQRLERELSEAVGLLKDSICTRRAVATTWRACEDYDSNSVPCLIAVDFLVRDGKLHLTAYFRSHDIKQAWPQNAYGLWRLQEKVSHAVNVEVGSLTTISTSAHIYLDGGKRAWP